ncbi:4-hydroxybenzoate polyprenyltransferase [Murinocardiopsis flavida]|uniref:4-hydroxybenzoate polyprenyltransferase n=1 Tax=Murinocardiopsis flavida TaxID=645275 RepID=A0A2P8DLF1_9ACTN|nr:UbiA family prenyltransferase [Murinocardiopsis flavida]PSK98049.1 4-hydroxybenzoate polyprenyltransferase [Murinocardiopsis flavida]
MNGARLRALAELVRAPAALSVPGDALAGAAAAGYPQGRRTAFACAASVCLYWAGMALNDYADRDLDAVERPERPIPSGRVSPGAALGTAAALTGAGLVCAAAAHPRALTVAVPLAATAWSYDLWLKPTPAGPYAMGLARGLDVLLGAAPGGARAALPSAAAMAAHTVNVTRLSRDEVHGTTPARAGAAAAATAAVAAAVAARAGTGAGPRTDRAAAAALAAGYGALALTPQLAAARDPSAARVRAAVGGGIVAMVPLQAALTSLGGSPRRGAALAALVPAARALTKRIAAT